MEDKKVERLMLAVMTLNNLQSFLNDEINSLLAGRNITNLSALEVITDRIEKEVDEYMAKLHRCSKSRL